MEKPPERGKLADHDVLDDAVIIVDCRGSFSKAAQSDTKETRHLFM